jgi:hypothetical protein
LRKKYVIKVEGHGNSPERDLNYQALKKDFDNNAKNNSHTNVGFLLQGYQDKPNLNREARIVNARPECALWASYRSHIQMTDVTFAYGLHQ